MSGQTPLGYLAAAGERAQAIVPLTWFVLSVSILVCVVIAVLLWVALRRGRASAEAVEIRAVAVGRAPHALRWIGVGLALSAVPLVVTLVWTMVTLAATAGPPPDVGLVLDVTGHQWWWEVHYDAARPDQGFTTANELHIPVNTRVLVRLRGADVIHSFWVPKLAGKTDTIPGQTNLAWLQASVPGRYLGQCTEYCGWQHAHMALEVVAESPQNFQRWRAAQLQPAEQPLGETEQRGRRLVEFRCGLCHEVRGTLAASRVGPDLTHLKSRRLIGAGVLPNTAGALSGWIEAAQGIKPGCQMPNQSLTAQQLADVVAYLETLQ
ncbi:MAG: cytochrome c oxidase subunit II [Gammaproteobacteria bacterium]|nr:cytochrome c oxidase subunit II [Gammaproteobacteria bacterium]